MKPIDTENTLQKRQDVTETQADIELLRQKVRVKAIEEKIINGLSGQKCPPPAVLAYVMDLQDKTLLSALEKHAAQCEQCKKILSDLKKAQTSGISLDLDIPRAEKPGKYELSPEALQMVVKQTKKYLELIKHTGEVANNMPKPVPGYIHGSMQPPMVIVRKDMPSYDLSIHVAMSGRFNTAQGEARFCAMKADVEKYIKGMKLSLTGEGNRIEKKTDKTGCAEFGGMKKGEYEIWSGEKLIASIKIK